MPNHEGLQQTGHSEAYQIYDCKQKFSQFWSAQGYNVRKPYRLNEVPNSLLVVNSTIAPVIPRLVPNVAMEPLHDAFIQPCVRMNFFDESGVLGSSEWSASFLMGGIVSTQSALNDVIKRTYAFITESIGLTADRLVFSVHPDDVDSVQALREIVPESKIAYVEKNNDVWVNWQFGKPGPFGQGITFLFDHGEDQRQGSLDIESSRYGQFLNVIHIDTYVDENSGIHKLPCRVIDVGFGMERLISLATSSKIFNLPMYKVYLEVLGKAAGVTAVEDDIRLVTIADSIRILKFLLHDEILPGKKGANYISRKVARNLFLQASLSEIGISTVIQLFPPSMRATLQSEFEAYQRIMSKAASEIRKLGVVADANKAQIIVFLKETHGIPPEISSSLLEKND